MSGGWYWARATLRRNLRGAALLVLLVAVGSGATMALAAGARRTESSYRRLVAVSNEFDAFVAGAGSGEGAGSAADEERLRRLGASPQVADSMVIGEAHLHPVGATCGAPAADYYPLFLPLDDGDPYRISRPRVLSGRLPRPGVADEVALPELIAARLRLGVGGELLLFSPGSAGECRDAATSARQPATARLRVVGVFRRSFELGLRDDDYAMTMLPFAFRAAHPDVQLDPFALVRLKAGPAGFADFEAEAARAGFDAESAVLVGGGVVQPALDTAATGLWLTAGVVALGTLAALAIALLRQAGAASRELRVLAALGVWRRGAAAGAAAPAAVAVVLGVAASMVVAVGASPGLPIGLGRRADPDPGVHADWTVLAAGALTALGVGLVLAGLAAGRAVRVAGQADGAAGPRRPSRLLGLLHRAGTPPWATIGSGYALGTGRGARVSPGAVAGATLGVTGVVAVTLFGLSLERTITDPQRYGWGQWDGLVSPDPTWEDPTPEPEAHDAPLAARILADPAVEADSLVLFRSELALDGEPVWGVVVWPQRGRAGPTVLSGRLPERSGEIALGAGTARRLGVGVGDTVRAGTGGADQPVDQDEQDEQDEQEDASATSPIEVVGIAAAPAEEGLLIGDGFVLPSDWWADHGHEDCAEGCFEQHAVALADGADRDAFATRMAGQGAYVTWPEPGGEVRSLDEVESLPRILAVLLGLVAALGLAHTLWVTPRRRRRDLATLRSLGFTPVQVRRVLHTQAAVVSIAGVAGGLIAGALTGRLAWEAAAEVIGVPTDLHIRPLPLLAVALAAVAGARLLAVLPGRVAGRATPAFGLREES